MKQLPTNVKPLDLIKALERNGFIEKKGKGSHRRLVHPDGRWTQVAVHPKPIPVGTLRKIISQTGLTVEQFEASL